DPKRWPELKRPTGIVLDGASHLLVLDAGSGKLARVRLASGTAEPVADGFGEAGGIAWDRFGRLYISDEKAGRLFAIARPGAKPVMLTEGLQAPVDFCIDATGKLVLVADRKAGTLIAVPAQIPGAEVDDRPLPLTVGVAYPDLKWV